MDGRHHKNEESWHDGCRECYCHSGREMCALITCPVPACGNPAIHPGQCCPSCSGKSWLPSRALPKQMTSALQGLITSVTLGDTQGTTLGAHCRSPWLLSATATKSARCYQRFAKDQGKCSNPKTTLLVFLLVYSMILVFDLYLCKGLQT